MISKTELAKLIDHTLLTPEATNTQINELITEAEKLGTYSVCVSPHQLPLKLPQGLHLATVCGFPTGAHYPQIKAAEAKLSAQQGAEEIDMVANLKNIKENNWQAVQEDITAVRHAIPETTILKVIIESAALSDTEIIKTCQCAMEAQADFVKTSTGFHPAGGASAHAVQLMRQTVGDTLGVKASGGIRTLKDALTMIDAGASRLGLSASKKILNEMM